MGSQVITLAALENEYRTDNEAFRQKAIDILFPSAVLGTALAARGEAPFRYPQRWACLAGLKAAGLLAMKAEVSVAFLIAEKIGVKDPAEAEKLIAAATKARQASPLDTLRLAKRIVRDAIMADPDERRRTMQELFGMVDALEPHHSSGNGSPVSGASEPEKSNTRARQADSRANGSGSNGHG